MYWIKKNKWKLTYAHAKGFVICKQKQASLALSDEELRHFLTLLLMSVLQTTLILTQGYFKHIPITEHWVMTLFLQKMPSSD